jgi:hypothetical protein
MKIEKARAGMVVESKLNGRRYQISQVMQQDGTVANLLKRVNPEDHSPYEAGSEEFEEVLLTSENDICFRTIFWPMEETPKGFEVSDGVLLRNGIPVTLQGEIYIISLLGTLPGELVLCVQTRERDETLADVMLYSPARDRFEKVASKVPRSICVVRKLSDSRLILGYNHTRTRTVKATDEEDTAVGQVEFLSSKLILLEKEENKKTEVIKRRFDQPMDFQTIVTIRDNAEDGNKSLCFLVGTRQKTVESEDGITICEESDLFYELANFSPDYFPCENMFPSCFPSEITDASFNRYYRYGNGGFLLTGKNFICLPDTFIRSSELEKINFPEKKFFLVDAHTTLDDPSHLVVTLANQEYDVVHISQTKTSDRGQIVDVEISK